MESAEVTNIWREGEDLGNGRAPVGHTTCFGKEYTGQLGLFHVVEAALRSQKQDCRNVPFHTELSS